LWERACRLELFLERPKIIDLVLTFVIVAVFLRPFLNHLNLRVRKITYFYIYLIDSFELLVSSDVLDCGLESRRCLEAEPILTSLSFGISRFNHSILIFKS